MSKFLYPIYKLKTKSYIKWWLYHKKAGGSGVLSEILEGFSFNLENTLNRKFKLFETEGNSEQVQYSGKNLANTKITNWSYLGVSVTYDEATQILTINGTSTGNASLSFGNYNFSPISVSSGERLNLAVKYVSGSAISNDNGRILLADENYTLSMSIPLNGINTDKSEYKNVNANLNYNTLQFGYRTGDVYNNLKIKIMICKGTDISYEPYVGGIASPNPKYEQPIYSAGDNENIWNGEIERGAINGDGLDVDATNRVRNVGYYELNKGTYTLSYKGAEQSVVYIFNANKVKVNNPSWENGKSTFTLEENGYIKYALKQSDNREMNVNDVSEIKLERGNKATPYSPYGMGSINQKITNSDGTKEQDYSIFVQQPMRSIGDVRDCFVKKSDGWYERHYIKYLELLISAMNNSENYPGWTNVQQIKNDFPNINTQLITKTSFLCNIFEKTSRIMVINTVGNNSILYLDKSLLNLTQTQWKEKYPDLILKLAYISPLPLDLPCTEEQIQQLENKPSTYKDFTIIQSEDETPAHLKIQYWKEV